MPEHPGAMHAMQLSSDRCGNVLTLKLSGDWSIDRLSEIEQALTEVESGASQVKVDCSQLEHVDLSSAWLIRNRLNQLTQGGAKVEFAGKAPSQFAFVEEITKDVKSEAPAQPSGQSALAEAMVTIGKSALEQLARARDALDFYGRVLVTGFASLKHPKRLRLASITRHIYEAGIQAVPIVALIAFLITLVIAYIGAQQLKSFGAEIFTVNLVTVGVLREMGVLLTAIIVAGRSGSAFAAEIGVMQLNEEVDALKSIGVNIYEVLVIPRVLGLVIALPLLVIVADAMGLAGGALLCKLLLGISLPQYIARMQDALAATTFWAGFIKAPAFAFLIAMTGTYRGMQVRDSSRELGRLTTVAVVQSIFLVILANAVFAIVYMKTDF